MRVSNGGSSPYLRRPRGPQARQPARARRALRAAVRRPHMWTALNLARVPAAHARRLPRDGVRAARRAAGRPAQPAAAARVPRPAPAAIRGSGRRDAGAAAELRDGALQRLSRVLARRRATGRRQRVSLPLDAARGDRRRWIRQTTSTCRRSTSSRRSSSASSARPSRGGCSSSSPRPGDPTDDLHAAVARESRAARRGPARDRPRARGSRRSSTPGSSTRRACRRASSCPTTRCCTSARRPTRSRTAAARASSARRSCRSSAPRPPGARSDIRPAARPLDIRQRFGDGAAALRRVARRAGVPAATPRCPSNHLLLRGTSHVCQQEEDSSARSSTIVAVAAASTAAYAYWTAGGSGTGSGDGRQHRRPHPATRRPC